MKRISVTIGIPAYQSEKNIGQLLNSLVRQKEGIIDIEKILVYVDACTDKTAEKVKEIKDPRIKLYIGTKNRGYASSLQFLIDKNKSEVFVELNDDIKIESLETIQNLIKPLLKDPKIGLVGGNILALQPKTFIGKCIYTSYLAFQSLRLNYRNGVSRLTVDGKILAIRKDLASKLSLDKNDTGNTDVFIYFACLKKGFKYAFAKEAQVLYRLPESFDDFRNQEQRTMRSFAVLRQQFGEIVEKEWSIPKRLYILGMLKVFLKYPLNAMIFKIGNSFYLLPKEKSFKTWKLAKTTKEL